MLSLAFRVRSTEQHGAKYLSRHSLSNSCTRTALGGRDLLMSSSMRQGWNTTSDGKPFYFIATPSAGLSATREKLFNRPSGFVND
jgi:hypothetical protein